MNTYHSLAKIVTVLASIISLLVFIAIPAGYLIVAYSYETEVLQTEANHSASGISEIIHENPDSWQLNERRLAIALILHSSITVPHSNRISDAQGKNITYLPVDIASPIISRSATLTDGDNIVGSVEIAQSLRPLLVKTAITTLISAGLALAIYFVLRIMPLRALNLVAERLDESRELLRLEILAKEQALLEAQNISNAMRHQAMHDGLTHLPNRSLLQDRLQQALLLNQREQKMLALIMLDLDKFKVINDTLGHPAGDLVLQEVATRMQQALRSSDTIARMGGDEFAILLISVTGHEGVVIAAQKIITSIRQPMKVGGRDLHVGASLGIAYFPEHGDDPEQLFRCADVAMYRAKRANSGYAIYDAAEDAQNTQHAS